MRSRLNKLRSIRTVCMYAAAGFAVCLLVAGLQAGCKPGGRRGGKDAKEMEIIPINVEAAYPQNKDMDEVIEVNGNLEPKVHVEIFSKQSGLIEEIFVKEGDVVKKNDLLAKVEDDEIKLSFQQAKLAFQVAKEKYQRYVDLYKKNMVSAQEFEDLERAYRDAEVNLGVAKIRFENTEIRTPVAGTVVDRLCEPYHLVGTMEKVFEVAELEEFKILIHITEAEIGKIKKDQPVKIRLDALNPEQGEYAYTGYIDEISPIINSSSGTVEVEVRLSNPGGELKMGMFARLKIITARHPGAMVVPKKALIGEESDQIWLVKGESGELRKVETGIQDENYVEVLSGISFEDMVIIEGQTALTERSRIKVVNSPQPPESDQGAKPL